MAWQFRSCDMLLQGVLRPSGRRGHASAMLKDQQGRSHMVMSGGHASEDKLCQVRSCS